MTVEQTIQKIREELMDFAQELLDHAAEIEQELAKKTDAEVLALYVQHTFDVDWRGEVVEALVPVGV